MSIFDEHPFTENYPQPVDISSFQKELTRIFGIEDRSGRPWIRVIWMPSDKFEKSGEPEACDWDCYGNGGDGEWRRRYLYSSSYSNLSIQDKKTGMWRVKRVWSDISPPRFVIERLIPPSSALLGWRHTGIDMSGDRWTDRKPSNGRYEPAIFPDALKEILPLTHSGMIADHDAFCCKKAKEEQKSCYGRYAEPGRQHLDELRRLKYLLDKLSEERPGTMTTDQESKVKARTLKWYEHAFDKYEANTGEAILEAFKTHSAMLSDDPSVNTWGKYHFLSGHTKTGAPKGGVVLTDL